MSCSETLVPTHGARAPWGARLSSMCVVVVLAGGAAAAQAPPVGAQAMPDAATLAVHAALGKVLADEAAGIQGPAVDPSGQPIGQTVQSGLVLIRDATIQQFDQAGQQLNALKNASQDVQDQTLATLRTQAVEARDAFNAMNDIDINQLKGDLNGAARGSYEAQLRRADDLDKAGRHAEADAMRQQAADSTWGHYLAARQRFAKAVSANPLLGVRLPGGVSTLGLEQPYFFNRVLESAVPIGRTGLSVDSLRGLMLQHVDQALTDLAAQRARVAGMNSWSQLWELANPAFSATQAAAAKVATGFGEGYVDAVTATAKGAAAQNAYDNAFSNTALSILQVGSMVIPGVGPLISAGITSIQIYKSGDEFVVALGDASNAEQGATVTGFQTVLDAQDKVGAAGARLVVNVAMAPAEIPGFIQAVKAGKVVVRKGAQAAARAVAGAGKDAAVGVKVAGATEASAGAVVKTAETADAAAGTAKTETGVSSPESPLLARAEEAKAAGIDPAEVDQIVEDAHAKAEAATDPTEAIAEGDHALVEKIFAKTHPGAPVIRDSDQLITLGSVRTKARLEASGRPQTWTPEEFSMAQSIAKNPNPLDYWEFEDPFEFHGGSFGKVSSGEGQPGFKAALTPEDVANIKTVVGKPGIKVAPKAPPIARTATGPAPRAPAGGNAIGAPLPQPKAPPTGAAVDSDLPELTATGEPPRDGAGNPAAPSTGPLTVDAGKAAESAATAAANDGRRFATALDVSDLKPAYVGQLTDAELLRVDQNALQAMEDGPLKQALIGELSKRGFWKPGRTATGGAGAMGPGVLRPAGAAAKAGVANGAGATNAPAPPTSDPASTPAKVATGPAGLSNADEAKAAAAIVDDAPRGPTGVLGVSSKRAGLSADDEKRAAATFSGLGASLQPGTWIARGDGSITYLPPGAGAGPLPPGLPGPTATPPPVPPVSGGSTGSTGSTPENRKNGLLVGGGTTATTGGPLVDGGSNQPQPPDGPGAALDEEGKFEPYEHVLVDGPLVDGHTQPFDPLVQPLILHFPPMTVERTATRSSRGAPLLARTLVDWLRAWSADRSTPLVPSLYAPRVPVPAPFPPQRGDGAAKSLLRIVVTSLGQSQGEAFQLQIINDTLAPVRLFGDGAVVQALKGEAQQQMTRELQSLAPKLKNATAARVEGYCLAFGLHPPSPNQLFQFAPAALQNQFKSIAPVLGVADRLAGSGLLHPDVAAATYLESIKQYAVWTHVEHWNLKAFSEAWVQRTKQNAIALKRNWTKEMESALMSAAPGRWQDIQRILQEASAQAARP